MSSTPRLDLLRRRRHRRGAAVFLVVLSMTLLTMMGIFAARAASLTELVTGYDRQSTQTRYVLEDSVALVTSNISANPALMAMFAAAGAGTKLGGVPVQKSCASTAVATNVTNLPVPCYQFFEVALNKDVQQRQTVGGTPVTDAFDAVNNGAPPQANIGANIPGSLGPANIIQHIYVEASDFGPAGRPVPGMSAVPSTTAQFTYSVATLTAYGQVGPYTADAANNLTGGVCSGQDTLLAFTTTRQTGEGYILWGPN